MAVRKNQCLIKTQEGLQGVPNNDSECLKVPSGKTLRVSRITTPI
jgi:hypothetical protein